MASAGNGLVVADGVIISLFQAKIPAKNQINDGPKCTSFFVTCRDDSDAPIGINVPQLHREGEFAGIQPGVTIVFRLYNLGIARVNAQGLGGDATIDFGVAAMTAETG